MRILITNNTLVNRAGSELYVRDLAIALMKRGHFPVTYSMALGQVAEELRRATIPVIDNLEALSDPPDVIHGQHHLETMTAALHFPGVPTVFACHGWMPWQEMPPVFPALRHYVAVDDLCRERLLTTLGVSRERVEVIYNFVDLERFERRGPLPDRPARVLIFTNHCAPSEPWYTAIHAACQRFGIARVDVVGISAGNPVVMPEAILRGYDLVFAKARCALEAMATGCAVIVADRAGLGGYVSMENVANLRRLNFGVRTMQAERVTEESVLRELACYDAADAGRVCDFIRTEADMDSAVDRWLSVYDQLLMESTASEAQRIETYSRTLSAASGYLRRISPWLKSRQEVEQRLHQFKIERDNLSRQNEETLPKIASLQAELSSLNDTLTKERRAAESEIGELSDALQVIHDSPGWKAVTLYRRFRRWILRL